MKLKFTFRIWLLIIILALSLLAIKPSFSHGVVVKSVDTQSVYYEQGIRTGQKIISINSVPIATREDYANEMNNLFGNSSSEVRLDIKTDKGNVIFLANETPSFVVDDIPATRLQTGLDLRGGARALVQADVPLNDNQLQDLVEISRNRFNVYGLSDVNVKGVTDLSGGKYMLIEVAGATPQDLEDLILQQGNFEAKVGNISVFKSADKDITDVCKNDAKCSGISSCSAVQGGYACTFQFAVYLSEEAAERHAEITKNLGLDETGRYLTDKLYLYIDGKEVNVLSISANLRGQKTTEISIQGSGTGATQQDALAQAKIEMNKLQTVLKTGSIPYKLHIVKLDTISPTLGDQFTKLILLAGLVSIVLVGAVIFIRYRNLKASLAILFTSFSEIIIILGIASLIKWNLDLPSIAGILATIGTGVDQQIVILDEAKKDKALSIKERMKRALFIVMSAYAVSLVSLLPLYWAGAGLFKGFAITTIIGITAGVFISRPAFADIIKSLED